jgi:ABC-2 type transport system ATP-binding protein
VIAQGSAAQLKTQTGGARLELTLSDAHPRAEQALAPFVAGPVHVSRDGRRLRAPVRSAGGLASTVVRALDQAQISVDDVEVRQPSLDDVFFALTGSATDHAHDGAQPAHSPSPSPSDLEVARS